jgi:hypothetical protein
VPTQQIGIAGGAVDVEEPAVEPDDVGGELGPGGGVEGSGPGEEVDAEIDSRTRPEQVLDLGIGLGLGEPGVDGDERELGDAKAQSARELDADHLRYQRQRALAGAGPLDDIDPVVVGLEQPGERSALAQGRDVARRGDLQERRHRDRAPQAV